VAFRGKGGCFKVSVLWVALAFFSGALPFSIWVGNRFLHTDIRDYGDANPGATNVARAGGWRWGGLAVLLDFLKGAIPVGVAYLLMGVRGLPMVAIAIAPPLGHAFSPFLGGRGGKALATTFGIWSGLTVGEVPIILGLFFALWLTILDVDAWAVMLGMASLLAHLLLNHRDPLLLTVWLANTLLLGWTHRRELKKRPRLRGWIWQKMRRHPSGHLD